MILNGDVVDHVMERLKVAFSLLSASTDKGNLLEQISVRLNQGEEVVVFCSLMPISMTYHHLSIAKIIANLTQVGLRVVINVQDISMMHYPLFFENLRLSPEREIDNKIRELEDLMFSLGAVRRRISTYKLSSLLERFVLSKAALANWYGDTSVRIPTPYIEDRERLDFVIADTLDVTFARNLRTLNIANNDAKFLLSGSSKRQVYCELVGDQDPVVLCYPRLPKFRIDKGSYAVYLSSKDRELDRIMPYVDEYFKNINKENLQDSKDRILNLYQYYFPLFLSGVRICKSDGSLVRLVPESALRELHKLDFLKVCEPLKRAIALNFKESNISIHDGLEEIQRQRELMPKLDVTSRNKVVDLFKVLSNEGRLDVLMASDGTRRQKDIAKKCSLSYSTVSEHLKALHGVGLVDFISEKPVRRVNRIPEINLPQLL